MRQIPMQPPPSQNTQVVLGGQNCQISIYQKSEGLLFDLVSDNVTIVCAVLAHDCVPLVCRQYMGFLGDLMFVDTQGVSDPTYAGLGGRFALVYLTASERELI